MTADMFSLFGGAIESQEAQRDSTTANWTDANKDRPSPFMDLPQLIQNFKKHGLKSRDLVALTGGHTLGFANCSILKTASTMKLTSILIL